MSYKLIKPYTNKQMIAFKAEYNRKRNLTIKETATALYALEPWEKLVNDEVLDNKDEYKEEQAKKELEQTAMLCLTAADVERAIYKAKGLDFEDILNLVKDNSNIDVKALKIEFKANNFYRGNEYVNIIGEILGYSSDDLDYLFKNKELPDLEQEVNDDGMVL